MKPRASALWFCVALIALPAMMQAKEIISLPISSYSGLFDRQPIEFVDHKPVVRLDLDRLTGIDYAMVSPGGKISQMFGHAMLRLNFAPSESLDLYTEPTYFINFTSIIVIDPTDPNKRRKVLIGQLMPASSVEVEYTFKDKRDIYAYPLDINGDQQKELVRNFAKIANLEQGEYDVFNNNCVTGIVRIYNIVAGEGKKINPKNLPPKALAGIFRRKQVITQEPLHIDASPTVRARKIQLLADLLHVSTLEIEKTDELPEAQRLIFWKEVLLSEKAKNLKRFADAADLVIDLETYHLQQYWVDGARKYKKKIYDENADPKPTFDQIRAEVAAQCAPIVAFRNFVCETILGLSDDEFEASGA